MDQQPGSLKSLFADAESRRETLDNYPNSNSEQYQDILSKALATYEECLKVVDRISLFSPNESLEDVSSGDLQYLTINYHLANLVQRITGGERKAYLQRAQEAFDRFFKLLDHYDALSKADTQMYQSWRSNPKSFSAVAATDASKRREIKIARSKEERQLKQKLQYLRRNPSALENDEDTLRDLHMTNLSYLVHQSFSDMESISQELQILTNRPNPPSSRQVDDPSDIRQRSKQPGLEYSERLETSIPLSSKSGPILDKSGKLIRPFTLLDKRTQFQNGVFRPDHSLPTMTIDEYLEEEKRRGGIIEGGGEQSGIRPEPNEDDFALADAETMKAREWDEFTEDNPKGSGNTMNLG